MSHPNGWLFSLVWLGNRLPSPRADGNAQARGSIARRRAAPAREATARRSNFAKRAFLFPCQQKTHFFLLTKVRFLNEAHLRCMKNEAAFGYEALLRNTEKLPCASLHRSRKASASYSHSECFIKSPQFAVNALQSPRFYAIIT